MIVSDHILMWSSAQWEQDFSVEIYAEKFWKKHTPSYQFLKESTVNLRFYWLYIMACGTPKSWKILFEY